MVAMKMNAAVAVLCFLLPRVEPTLGAVAPSSAPFGLTPTPTESPSLFTSALPIPTSQPSMSLTFAPTQNTSSVPPSLFPTESQIKTIQAPTFRWSLLLPLLAVSALAWTFRKSSRRCLCMIPTDATIPEEIIIDPRCVTHPVEEDDSVVGDRDTDVELVPVHTLRSHDWSELGQDPIQGRSDYYTDFYSEAMADFVAMEDV
eukprot:scaffold2363_cov159-Amphora_coffeaeformis.AAC.1